MAITIRNVKTDDMKKVAVLGAGMVRAAIAIDHSKNFEVFTLDVSEKKLRGLQQSHPCLQIKVAGLSNHTAYAGSLEGFDLVVCAVPGFWKASKMA